MILCHVDKIFDDIPVASSFDLDSKPAIITDNHSFAGYLHSFEKQNSVLFFDDVDQVIQLADKNSSKKFLLNLGIPTNPLVDSKEPLMKFFNKIKPYKNIEVLFANGWDYYSGKLYKTTTTRKELIVNRKDLYLEAISTVGITLNRIHFWICNVFEVNTFKRHFHPADVQYFSIYPKRMMVQQCKAGLDVYRAPNKSVQREWHFLCLNNYDKPHRTQLVEAFRNNPNLKDKVLYSYLNPQKAELQRHVDGIHDPDQLTEWQDALPHHIPDSCYFYISTETHFDNEKTLIEINEDKFDNPVQGWWSEKTFKAMYYELPFLIVAPTSTLKFLREIGFETFPEIFDETYDNIVDSHERLELIKGEIFRICSMSKKEIHDLYYSDSVQRKLKHNKLLFLDLERDTPYNIFYNYNTPEMELIPHKEFVHFYTTLKNYE